MTKTEEELKKAGFPKAAKQAAKYEKKLAKAAMRSSKSTRKVRKGPKRSGPKRSRQVVMYRGPRKGGRKLMGGSTRVLLQGRVPRHRMKVSGTGDNMRVSGMDVVQESYCSNAPISVKLNVNPTLADLFPKLSGMALQFEKYRFNKLRVRYFSAAPATRSGAIGMLISKQYLGDQKVPSSVPDFAAFEHSAVGSVAENFATPMMINKGSQFYYMPDLATSTTDPLVVFQHTLGFLARDAVSADDKLIAGYIAIEYDVQFQGLRGTRQRCIAGANAQSQTITYVGGGLPTNQEMIDLKPGDSSLSGLLQMVGNWGFTKAIEYISGLTGLDAQRQMLGNVPPGGAYAATHSMTLGAVGTTTDEFVHIPKPPLKRQTETKREDGEGVTYYNPDCVHKPDSSWVPMSQDETGKRFVPTPLVASSGDWQLSLQAYSSDTQAYTNIVTHTGSGTGAFTNDDVVYFTQVYPNDSLFWCTLLPYSGDTRRLAAGDFMYDVIARSTGG